MRRPSSMDSSIKLGQSRPSFFPDDFHAHGADDGVDGGVDTSLSDDSSSDSGSDDLYVPKRKASPKGDLNLTDSLRLLDWKSQQMVDPHARTPRSKKARNHGSRRRYKPQLVSIDVDAVTPRVLSSRDVTPEASSRPQSGSDHQKLTGLKILDKALGSRRSCESAAPGATAARNGKDSRSHHKHKHSKDQRHKAERQHRHRSQKDGNSQLDEASYTEVEHVSIESSSTTPSSRPARVENYAPSECVRVADTRGVVARLCQRSSDRSVHCVCQRCSCEGDDFLIRCASSQTIPGTSSCSHNSQYQYSNFSLPIYVYADWM